MRLLTVCGSLRAQSSNLAVLRAFSRVVPADVQVLPFEGMGTLPLFNPDVESGGLPGPVAAWRAAVRHADALVFSTPEYAHALPGAFKNALDWLVGGTEIADKPVAVLHVARGTTWAYDSLREVLTTMSARWIDAACVSLALGSNLADGQSLLARAEIRHALETSAAKLCRAVPAR